MNATDIEAACLRRGVPEHLVSGIVHYLVNRIEPGGFLLAVLSNDLMGAFGRADEQSRWGMPSLVTFIYNDIPSTAWGSPEKVRRWLAGE